MDANKPVKLEDNQSTDSLAANVNSFLEKLVNMKFFSYLFMVSLLFFILLCGYILRFSGSLFIEAIVRGWWKPDATEFDSNSFFYGYLFGFPSLCGVVGGVIVLSTNVMKMFKFKVLFFIPSVVWSALLVLDILRRPVSDWYHWLYLMPALFLSMFVLFCVVKKVKLPYMKK